MRVTVSDNRIEKKPRSKVRAGKPTYRLPILILTCLGVFLGCPDPREDMRFRQNDKIVDEIRIESVDGRGSLKVFGSGFYFQTGDRKFHLRVECVAKYPGIANDLSLDPLAIRATLNGDLLPVEKYWVDSTDFGADKGSIYVRLLCRRAALREIPDSLTSSDSDELLLDFSDVIRKDDKAIFTDTVYAVIPERIRLWVRRLQESK